MRDFQVNTSIAILLSLNIAILSLNTAMAQNTESIEQDQISEGESVPAEADTPLPLDQIKTFANIFTRIKLNYVEQVTDSAPRTIQMPSARVSRP